MRICIYKIFEVDKTIRKLKFFELASVPNCFDLCYIIFGKSRPKTDEKDLYKQKLPTRSILSSLYTQ